MNNQDNTPQGDGSPDVLLLVSPVLDERRAEDTWAQLCNDLSRIPLEDPPTSLDSDSLPEFYFSQLSHEQRIEVLDRHEKLYNSECLTEVARLYQENPNSRAIMILEGIWELLDTVDNVFYDVFDGGSGDEFSDDEYSYPVSEPSAPNEGDIPEELLCGICGCHETTVQFQGCSHAACTDCTKGIWCSRKRSNAHFPNWFPCHMCRAEIKQVGMLEGIVLLEPMMTVQQGEWTFGVKEWVPVKVWMTQRSKRVAGHLELMGEDAY